MKMRMGKRYIITVRGGGQFWGDCPQWAADIPAGATVVAESFRGVVCDCDNCGQRHARGVYPWTY